MTPEQTTQAESDGPREDKPSLSRRILIVGVVAFLGIGALVLAATILASVVSGDSAVSTLPAGTVVDVEVSSGESARQIAEGFEAAGVIGSRRLLDAINAQRVSDQLKAGTYRVEAGTPADELVVLLVSGPNTAVPGRSVTIIEGWTVRRVLDELASQTDHSVEAYESALLSGGVGSPFLPADLPDGVDPLSAWEGLLFPARYELGEDDAPAEILNVMAAELVRRVEGIDWSRLGELSVDRYGALVVGSLVEREAGLDEERPLMASVIYNRLEEGMRLQIDATVIYALGDNPGRVLTEHLEVESPYNTYRVDGLPPTPIGTIGEASLRAAADPADSPYFFYVLASADGSHAFAETYEEHQENVRIAREEGVLP